MVESKLGLAALPVAPNRRKVVELDAVFEPLNRFGFKAVNECAASADRAGLWIASRIAAIPDRDTADGRWNQNACPVPERNAEAFRDD
jgi:hypothetical protein